MNAISVFIIIVVLFIIMRNFSKTTLTTSKQKSKNLTTITVDEIPEIFSEFPEYPGVLLEKPQITSASSYTRITMIYNDYINESYAEKLQIYGFKKASNVRYDKDDTYVIVEEIDDTTKIVFHLKNTHINTSSFIKNNNENNYIDDGNNPISF